MSEQHEFDPDETSHPVHSAAAEQATGRGPLVAREPAADRLMRSLDYRLSPGVDALTRAQVAVVLHALADHTALTAALQHRRDPGSPWPEANSLGRWLHDVGDQLEGSEAGETSA